MCVPLFSASSTTSVFIRSVRAATKRSWMPCVTMRRDDAVQRWPVAKNAPFAAHSTATARSASSSTTSGFLPPISSWNFFMPSAHAAAIALPVATDPVNEIAAMSGCRISVSPTTEPRPITRLKTPGGMPDSTMICASACAVAGTRSAGLKTTQFPYARAGAIFQAGIAIGKFHGVINPTTPSGSRVTSTSIPGRTDAIFSPAMRTHSPAKKRKIWPARTVSPTPSAIVLPSSRARSSPSSSLRARIVSPMRFRMSWRC